MKTQKHSKSSTKKSRTVIWIITTILVLCLVGVGAYAFFSNQHQTSNNDHPDVDIPDTDSPSDPDDGKDRNIEEEPDETITDPQASLRIADLSQSNQLVHITVVGEHLPADGRCIVYFSSNAEQIVSKYLDVTSKNGGVECSLDINEVEFSYLGEWKARVTYTTADDKIIETKGNITIK